MENKKRNKPKRRFAGFTDDWEERKVANIAEYSKGNGYSKSDLTEVGTPIILYGRLYTNYQFAIDEVDTFATPKNGAVYSQGNEVLIPASGETAEDIARASAVEKSGVLLGGDLNILWPFDFINPLFLALAISSGEPQKELAKKAQGKSVVHIHNSDIQEVSVSYPLRAEQDQIVAVFRNLDHLITLHQRKLDKLGSIKKSYLSEMFPQEGEKKPKRRFKGFTDDWEKRKLGEIADVTKLAGFEFTEHIVYSDEGNIIALRGLNIKNGQLILDDVKYIDDSNFSKLDRSKLYINDIMFTYVGTVGEVAVIKENDRFYLAPNVSRIRIESDDSPEYISQYMRTEQFYKKIIFPLIATSSQPALSMENIRKFIICLPQNKEEQSKIAGYLSHLDHLITLHQRKLEKLKNIKQAYLNEMFV